MFHNLDNLLIHIGYHKTGSTWLQKQLFTSGNEVFEPLSMANKGHSTLAKHFIYDAEDYLLSPFDYNEEAIRNALSKILNANEKVRSKIPVLSHERLSGNPHSGGFDSVKIALMLKRIFPKARILIVIREQKSFILSNYFQYLSIGGLCGIEKYLDTKYDGRRPFFSPSFIDFVPLVSKYHDLYGEQNVLVLPYELFKLHPQEFITSIERFLSLNININSITFDIFLNKKKDHFLMHGLRFTNLFRRSTSVNNYSWLCNCCTMIVAEAGLNILGKVVPDRLNRITTERLKRIIYKWTGTRYLKSNQMLSKIIGIDLSEYGYF
ncbi:putative sulfotransferase domain protein [Desulfosarcina variabilis str. Montpellier]|uniref:sulfotransferase domain-containing protein n=1 Tax=Desulfosarcina variabilis TaxID=2300 RepID=UPI003AFB2F7A